MDIEDEIFEKAVIAYRALLQDASGICKDICLTEKEKNAVFLRAVNNLMDKAAKRLNITEDENNKLKVQFFDFLRKKYPELVLQTSLTFDPEKGFLKKSN